MQTLPQYPSYLGIKRSAEYLIHFHSSFGLGEKKSPLCRHQGQMVKCLLEGIRVLAGFEGVLNGRRRRSDVLQALKKVKHLPHVQ